MKRLTLLFVLLSFVGFSQVNLQNNLFRISSTGDLAYNYMHAIGNTDSVAVSIGGTANVYYKIITGSTTWKEADGITAAGDSVTIITSGDYTFHCWLSASTSNASDIIRIKNYVNSIASSTSLGEWIIKSNGNNVNGTSYYMWYKLALTAGQRISFYATNLSGNRAIVIRSWKIFVDKKPE